jgi:putative intracellular protease/amidase
VTLYPALTVLPDATIASFDAAHPEGADYVVVPAMRPTDDPRVLRWLRAQAARGAIIVAVCAGARVAADAGLLEGRRATTHWFYLRKMLDAHPAIHYVPDRRFVVDRGVATTTGITASMPAMLTLVEAIAGRQKAREVANGLGMERWDARHSSAMFAMNRRFAATVAGNVLAFWKRDELGIALHPGMDEVTLALVADAWSRTYRSRAFAYSDSTGPVSGRGGIRFLPDAVRKDWPAERRIPGFDGLPAATALDRALEGIADRYGMPTSRAVALQLEYPGPAIGGGPDGGP